MCIYLLFVKILSLIVGNRNFEQVFQKKLLNILISPISISLTLQKTAFNLDLIYN